MLLSCFLILECGLDIILLFVLMLYNLLKLLNKKLSNTFHVSRFGSSGSSDRHYESVQFRMKTIGTGKELRISGQLSASSTIYCQISCIGSIVEFIFYFIPLLQLFTRGRIHIFKYYKSNH